MIQRLDGRSLDVVQGENASGPHTLSVDKIRI